MYVAVRKCTGVRGLLTGINGDDGTALSIGVYEDQSGVEVVQPPGRRVGSRKRTRRRGQGIRLGGGVVLSF